MDRPPESSACVNRPLVVESVASGFVPTLSMRKRPAKGQIVLRDGDILGNIHVSGTLLDGTPYRAATINVSQAATDDGSLVIATGKRGAVLELEAGGLATLRAATVKLDADAVVDARDRRLATLHDVQEEVERRLAENSRGGPQPFPHLSQPVSERSTHHQECQTDEIVSETESFALGRGRGQLEGEGQLTVDALRLDGGNVVVRCEPAGEGRDDDGHKPARNPTRKPTRNPTLRVSSGSQSILCAAPDRTTLSARSFVLRDEERGVEMLELREDGSSLLRGKIIATADVVSRAVAEATQAFRAPGATSLVDLADVRPPADQGVGCVLAVTRDGSFGFCRVSESMLPTNVAKLSGAADQLWRDVQHFEGGVRIGERVRGLHVDRGGGMRWPSCAAAVEASVESLALSHGRRITLRCSPNTASEYSSASLSPEGVSLTSATKVVDIQGLRVCATERSEISMETSLPAVKLSSKDSALSVGARGLRFAGSVQGPSLEGLSSATFESRSGEASVRVRGAALSTLHVGSLVVACSGEGRSASFSIQHGGGTVMEGNASKLCVLARNMSARDVSLRSIYAEGVLVSGEGVASENSLALSGATAVSVRAGTDGTALEMDAAGRAEMRGVRSFVMAGRGDTTSLVLRGRNLHPTSAAVRLSLQDSGDASTSSGVYAARSKSDRWVLGLETEGRTIFTGTADRDTGIVHSTIGGIKGSTLRVHGDVNVPFGSTTSSSFATPGGSTRISDACAEFSGFVFASAEDRPSLTFPCGAWLNVGDGGVVFKATPSGDALATVNSAGVHMERSLFLSDGASLMTPTLRVCESADHTFSIFTRSARPGLLNVTFPVLCASPTTFCAAGLEVRDGEDVPFYRDARIVTEESLPRLLSETIQDGCSSFSGDVRVAGRISSHAPSELCAARLFNGDSEIVWDADGLHLRASDVVDLGGRIVMTREGGVNVRDDMTVSSDVIVSGDVEIEGRLCVASGAAVNVGHTGAVAFGEVASLAHFSDAQGAGIVASGDGSTFAWADVAAGKWARFAADALRMNVDCVLVASASYRVGETAALHSKGLALGDRRGLVVGQRDDGVDIRTGEVLHAFSREGLRTAGLCVPREGSVDVGGVQLSRSRLSRGDATLLEFDAPSLSATSRTPALRFSGEGGVVFSGKGGLLVSNPSTLRVSAGSSITVGDSKMFQDCSGSGDFVLHVPSAAFCVRSAQGEALRVGQNGSSQFFGGVGVGADPDPHGSTSLTVGDGLVVKRGGIRVNVEDAEDSDVLTWDSEFHGGGARFYSREGQSTVLRVENDTPTGVSRMDIVSRAGGSSVLCLSAGDSARGSIRVSPEGGGTVSVVATEDGEGGLSLDASGGVCARGKLVVSSGAMEVIQRGSNATFSITSSSNQVRTVLSSSGGSSLLVEGTSEQALPTEVLLVHSGARAGMSLRDESMVLSSSASGGEHVSATFVPGKGVSFSHGVRLPPSAPDARSVMRPALVVGRCHTYQMKVESVHGSKHVHFVLHMSRAASCRLRLDVEEQSSRSSSRVRVCWVWQDASRPETLLLKRLDADGPEDMRVEASAEGRSVRFRVHNLSATSALHDLSLNLSVEVSHESVETYVRPAPAAVAPDTLPPVTHQRAAAAERVSALERKLSLRNGMHIDSGDDASSPSVLRIGGGGGAASLLHLGTWLTRAGPDGSYSLGSTGHDAHEALRVLPSGCVVMSSASRAGSLTLRGAAGLGLEAGDGELAMSSGAARCVLAADAGGATRLRFGAEPWAELCAGGEGGMTLSCGGAEVFRWQRGGCTSSTRMVCGEGLEVGDGPVVVGGDARSPVVVTRPPTGECAPGEMRLSASGMDVRPVPGASPVGLRFHVPARPAHLLCDAEGSLVMQSRRATLRAEEFHVGDLGGGASCSVVVEGSVGVSCDGSRWDILTSKGTPSLCMVRREGLPGDVERLVVDPRGRSRGGGSGARRRCVVEPEDAQAAKVGMWVVYSGRFAGVSEDGRTYDVTCEASGRNFPMARLSRGARRGCVAGVVTSIPSGECETDEVFGGALALRYRRMPSEAAMYVATSGVCMAWVVGSGRRVAGTLVHPSPTCTGACEPQDDDLLRADTCGTLVVDFDFSAPQSFVERRLKMVSKGVTKEVAREEFVVEVFDVTEDVWDGSLGKFVHKTRKVRKSVRKPVSKVVEVVEEGSGRLLYHKRVPKMEAIQVEVPDVPSPSAGDGGDVSSSTRDYATMIIGGRRAFLLPVLVGRG